MAKAKIFTKIIFVLFLIQTVLGCSTPKKQNPSTSQKLVKQVDQLEKEIQKLVVENSVLKTEMKTKKTNTIAKSSKKSVMTVQGPEKINGEHSLYAAVLNSYWSRDLEKTQRFTTMLLKSYPKSVHIDNALYLLGTLQYSENKLGESLQTFSRIVKEYPNSNKYVSAEMQKAEIYERLNLSETAQEIYYKIQKNYPGSPEANQAKIKIKYSKKAVAKAGAKNK